MSQFRTHCHSNSRNLSDPRIARVFRIGKLKFIEEDAPVIVSVLPVDPSPSSDIPSVGKDTDNNVEVVEEDAPVVVSMKTKSKDTRMRLTSLIPK